MNKFNHPDIEVLSAYIEQPEASDYGPLRIHLADCNACRQKVFDLSATVHKLFKYGPLQRFQQPKGLSEEAIADYVDNKIGGHARAQIQQQIENDPQALKAALHYACHSEEMNAALAQDKSRYVVEQQTIKQKIDMLMQTMMPYLSWRAPIWASVPATAGLIVILMFGINFFSGTTLVNFQDKPYLVWQKKPNDTPSMAFFNQAKQRLEPSKKINFKLKFKSLIVNWEAVDRAKVYRLQITYVDQSGQKLVKKIETNTNGAIFEDVDAVPQRHHSWRLSGETKDRRYFHMQGGFVVPEGG